MSAIDQVSRSERLTRDNVPIASTEFLTLAEISRFLRRYFLTIAIPIAIAVVTALAYIGTAKPIYEASAELLIDPRLQQPLRETGADTTTLFDVAQLESQMALLQSSKVAAAVVLELGLEKDPEFNDQKQPSIWSRIVGRTETNELSAGRRTENAVAAVRGRLNLRRIGASYGIILSFPSFSAEKAARIVNAVTDAYLNDLIETRAEAARQGSLWLEERVAGLRKAMNEAARRVQEFRASHDYRITKRTSGPLGGEPQTTKSDSAQTATTLEELESTAATYRKIYENFYQAFTEAVQRESYPVSNARVISAAIPPTSKSRPKSLLILAFAGLLGAISGVGFALFRNGADKPIRDARAIRNELGIACIGQIPTYRKSVGIGSIRHAASKNQLLRHSVNVPMTAFSRAIRSIKTSLMLEAKSRPFRLIGVASTSAGVGKTTIAANLAAQYGSPSCRTLLIDADVHRASLSAQLVPEANTGLMEVILGTSDFGTTVVQTDQPGLEILPMVRKPETLLKAQDVLSSDAMRDFIASISEDYAMIFFDMPPLKVATEGFIMATLLDGVILIAESDVTTSSHLDDVLYTLREGRTRILGLVINKISGRSRAAENNYYMKY